MSQLIQLIRLENGCWSFESSEQFLSFLELNPNDGGYLCKGQVKGRMRYIVSTPCGTRLAIAEIDQDIGRFVEKGFPSENAKICLSNIAKKSICIAQAHNLRFDEEASKKLNDKWHVALWQIYLNCVPGAPSAANQRPPALDAKLEKWAEAAASGPRPIQRVRTALSSSSAASRATMRSFVNRIRPILRIRKKHPPGPDESDGSDSKTAGIQNVVKRPSTEGTASGYEQPLPANTDEEPARGNITSLLTVPQRPGLRRSSSFAGSDVLTIEAPSFMSAVSPTASSVFSKGESVGETPDSSRVHNFYPAHDDEEDSEAQTPRRLLLPIFLESSKSSPRASSAEIKLEIEPEIEPEIKPEIKSECSTPEPGIPEDGPSLDSADRASLPCLRLYCSEQSDPARMGKLKAELKTKYPDINVSCVPPPMIRKRPLRNPQRVDVVPKSKDDLFRKWTPGKMPVLKSLIIKLHEPILDPRKLKPGFVYGFTCPHAIGHIKIGYTDAPEVEKRLREIASKCQLELVLLFSAKFPCVQIPVKDVEDLVHIHLVKQRRETTPRVFCRCDTKHGEWFEVDIEAAVEVLAKWMIFLQFKPFENRSLHQKWRDRSIKAWDKRTSDNEDCLDDWFDSTFFRP